MEHPYIPLRKHEQATLIILVVFSLVGLFYISSSFLLNIIFASIIAMSTYPFFLKLKSKFKLSNTNASIVSTLGVGAILVAPIIYVLTILGIESFELYTYLQQFIASLDFSTKESAVNGVLSKIDLSEEYIENVRYVLVNHIDIEGITKTAKNVLFFISQNALGNFLNIFIFFAVSLFTMFFLYRDGSVLTNKIKDISPLDDYYDSLLMKEVSRMSGILTLSIISIAFLQGASFALVTYFMGLDWLFLGVAVALTSFFPLFGTMIVWLSLAIFLYLTGNELQGLFIFGWGVIVISFFIDNILRPFIVSGICKVFDSKEPKNSNCENTFNPLNHTFIVTISTLGGVLKFSIIGLFLGPIIAGISIAILDIYRIRLKSMQKEDDDAIKNKNIDHLIDQANNEQNHDNFSIPIMNNIEIDENSESEDFSDFNCINEEFDNLEEDEEQYLNSEEYKSINSEFDDLDIEEDNSDIHKK